MEAIHRRRGGPIPLPILRSDVVLHPDRSDELRGNPLKIGVQRNTHRNLPVHFRSRGPAEQRDPLHTDVVGHHRGDTDGLPLRRLLDRLVDDGGCHSPR